MSVTSPEAPGGRGAAETSGGASAAVWLQQLRGDWASMGLLLLLYTLQGIPMGLAAAVPMLLKERGASLSEIGTFSVVSWPFSLKLIWAPIVDSVYSAQMGRRKTWLIPAQLLIAALLAAAPVESLLAAGEVGALTGCFGCLYLLCATQDIAVDGWALTMLSRRNVSLAATCNAAGQTLGFTLSFTGFLALQTWGLVTLGGFLHASAAAFLITTLGVWMLKREEPPAAGESAVSPAEACRQTAALGALPPVRTLLAVLMVWKAPFAPSDAVAGLKLQERGVPKEHLAYMATLLTPVSVLLPLLLARYTTGGSPLSVARIAYAPRLALVLCAAAAVRMAPPTEVLSEGGDSTRAVYYGCVFALLLLRELCSTAMFVAQMAFFARVSDPAIGGTYMTALNTAANLGGSWGNTAALKLCDSAAVGGVDGYYVLSAGGALLGVLWFLLAGRRQLQELDALELSRWRVGAGHAKFAAGGEPPV